MLSPSITKALAYGDGNNRSFVILESDVDAEGPYPYAEAVEETQGLDIVRLHDHPERKGGGCSRRESDARGGVLPFYAGIDNTWASGAMLINWRSVPRIQAALRRDVIVKPIDHWLNAVSAPAQTCTMPCHSQCSSTDI